MHVLIIEDDADLRRTLARVMCHFGFDAITLARNGAEALELIGRTSAAETTSKRSQSAGPGSLKGKAGSKNSGPASASSSSNVSSKRATMKSSSMMSSSTGAASRRPDVIVTDLQMPEMDGLGFARRLRGRGDATPMIMLSGHDDEDAVTSAIEAGVNCFLAKPVTVQDLADALRLVLPNFATAA
jgi:CheY-like chemotaxis protein